MPEVIGVIGVGRMGLAICGRLAGAGYEVLATDARPERAVEAERAGATWAGDPAQVGARADVICTVLADADQLREVMGELAPVLRSGTSWVDLTSVSPTVGHELRAQLEGRGIHCLEALLGGGVSETESGSEQLLVGAPRETFERHRDLLECLGQIEYMGEFGAGYTTKLLVNLLWFSQSLSVAEALLLARRLELDPARLRETLMRSAADSRFVREDLAGLLKGDYRRAFELDRCREELAAANALAAENGVPFELSGTVLRLFTEALARFGPVDGELLPVALLEERAGITIRRSSEL